MLWGYFLTNNFLVSSKLRVNESEHGSVAGREENSHQKCHSECHRDENVFRWDWAGLEYLLEPGHIAEKERNAKGKQRRRDDVQVLQRCVLDNAQPAAARCQQITKECDLNLSTASY